MYECFLEIAFEAELKNINEDPECLALAFEQCNENPVTRNASIRELRELIYATSPLREDSVAPSFVPLAFEEVNRVI
ncbi:hypothetical protein RR48_00377 [Papilio machaon]|uniref:Uncharacterized protein n=1 Tax=Papilio machaon TaxID=76193 RepID=A0A0N1PIW4_PAPMA|nr:hypothetical protein RR48_00377 [Papilio machaon]